MCYTTLCACWSVLFMLLNVFFLSSLYTMASQSKVTSWFATFWPCNLSQLPSCSCFNSFITHIFPDLIKQLLISGQFGTSRNWICNCQLHIYHVLYMWVQLKPKIQQTEPDKRQHDRPPSCVIAQQYSWTFFISLGFHFQKHHSMRVKKTLLFNLFPY